MYSNVDQWSDQEGFAISAGGSAGPVSADGWWSPRSGSPDAWGINVGSKAAVPNFHSQGTDTAAPTLFNVGEIWDSVAGTVTGWFR